jgi:hypothetical protein
MSEVDRDIDRKAYLNQVPLPLANRRRVSAELVEEILFSTLSQEIHLTLVTLSSFHIHFKRRPTSQLPDEHSTQEILTSKSSVSNAHRSMSFPHILGLLHVSRQFRSIMQRFLTTLCPVESQIDPNIDILLLTVISGSSPTCSGVHRRRRRRRRFPTPHAKQSLRP